MQYTDYAIKQYFETAKSNLWYNNTIFCFTGDHTNQVYYPEYERAMNRYAVPLVFYSPNPAYQLKGVSRKSHNKQIFILHWQILSGITNLSEAGEKFGK